jgi:hypothetical protein
MSGFLLQKITAAILKGPHKPNFASLAQQSEYCYNKLHQAQTAAMEIPGTKLPGTLLPKNKK